jgi:hypothetical protein
VLVFGVSNGIVAAMRDSSDPATSTAVIGLATTPGTAVLLARIPTERDFAARRDGDAVHERGRYNSAK